MTVVSHFDGTERRADRRYPVRVDLRYQVFHGKQMIQSGRGTALNISKSGLLFQSGHDVRAGLEIELFLAWPSSREGARHIELWAAGCAVRAQDQGCCAVRLVHSEFRRS